MSFTENQATIVRDLQNFFIDLKKLCCVDKPDPFKIGGLLDELSAINPEAYCLVMRADSAVSTMPHLSSGVSAETRAKRFSLRGFDACMSMLSVELIREYMNEPEVEEEQKPEREIPKLHRYAQRYLQDAAQVNYGARAHAKDLTPALMEELRTLMNRPIKTMTPEEASNWGIKDISMELIYGVSDTPMRGNLEYTKSVNMKSENTMIGIDMETYNAGANADTPRPFIEMRPGDWEALELATLAQAEEHNRKKASEEAKKVEDDMDWDDYTGRPKNPNPMAMWEDMHRELDEYDS